jgi:5-(carboxyamino)imidazole ribonucleotide mutase
MDGIDVSIIMGSDSDLSIMAEAAKIMEKFHILYSMTIASAHRTPELLSSYVQEMLQRNVKVFIAGAGGAAHLPGVIASLTALPVIGVPIKTSALNGVDSLYSIVQMPQGMPVAAVAINGAANAGLLAAQILSISDKTLAEKYQAYREQMKAEVEKKAARLMEIGYAEYLS